MLKKSLIFSGFMAIIAGNAFATGENIVTSKAYVDAQDALKQDAITTGNVLFYDENGNGVYNAGDDQQVPGLVAYDSTTGGLSGTKIGILDYETVEYDEGGLHLYSYDGGGYGAEMDNFVPTVRAVAEALQNIWDDISGLQAKIPAGTNGYLATHSGTRGTFGTPVDPATFQSAIPVALVEATVGQQNVDLPTLVSYDDDDGLSGEKIGLLTYDTLYHTETDLDERLLNTDYNSDMDTVVPTVKAVTEALITKQNKVPKSGYKYIGGSANLAYNTNAATDNKSWLNANVAGTGLVTRTATDGLVGERKIFEASDLSGYSALTGNNKLIADISIPTVGAMMSAISSGATAALPTGTTGTVVTYNGTTNGVQQFTETAIYNGSTTYAAATDANKIASMAGVTTYAQAKKVCAGWPDGTTTPDATHTDANCWLWAFPE